MENLSTTDTTFILLGFIIVWVISGVAKLRLFLLIAIIGVLLNTILFLLSIHKGIQPNIIAIAYAILWCCSIIAGSRQVPHNTQTILWDSISGGPLSVLMSGLHIIDPIFEYIAIGVKTNKNECIDMQKIRTVIHESDPMLTATPGIKAIIRHIDFMLKLSGNIRLLLDVEGGFSTIRERIITLIKEFLIKKVAKIQAVELDTGGHDSLHVLEVDILKEVSDFCKRNNYPYAIEEVNMADIVLPEDYYAALREKVIAILKADAADETAKRLVGRIVKAAGKFLDKSATKEQKLLAAQISLGIVKKDIKDNNFGLTGLTGEENKKLAKEIAIIALTKKAS